MAQLENIEAIEKRLWSAADLLRTGSNYASNEYFMPVMGLVFLRHAYSRFLNVKDEIVASLPSRDGKPRELKKADFSQKGAIFLQEKAQFDYLVSLSDDKDRATAVVEAMESIEADYETLSGVLPKAEYHELDNEVLGTLLRTLNPDELKKASGDIFGRIYEYFLTQFANDKAHDGGEFFTPVSLVSLIAHVLEPERGSVLDPACGSGGMFVQSAKFVEQMKANPSERLTFYGMEKNPTTIRLGKMNLAVHGLEGDIRKAISYYEDPHELLGKADYVMANPPFNTDEVDAEKVKRDPRLPFGLPGVNKKEKVSNGNYLWISYFYSYLSEKGRAGFVMSSQASSAGGEEAKVRQKLIETGAVEAMIDVRGNFFYTRSVPCQLWFFNKDKPAEHKDKVLMVDARNVYRKVTRKIFDFTPEQEKNLNSIFWLYRGQNERFVELVQSYVDQVLQEAHSCFLNQGNAVSASEPLAEFKSALTALFAAMQPFLNSLPKKGVQADTVSELQKAGSDLHEEIIAFEQARSDAQKYWNEGERNTAQDLLAFVETDASVSGLAEKSRDLVKLADHAYKLAARLIEQCEKELDAKNSDLWKNGEINGSRKSNLRKEAEAARKDTVEQLKRVRYFYTQAHWLLSRFPDGELRDVEGLVKLVDHTELASNDWSLTPGRYVGVAPEEVDEDFDFEEALRDIHVELAGLNEEAEGLAAQITQNFEELGI